MYDYIIVGSGFGGSVSALRLAEKGYKVLVVEKGKWFTAKDFPKTNWNLRKWLWLPGLRFFGIQKLSFLRHITVLSGVGVGGGSLVYANTLPKPKKVFYSNGSWAGLADWEKELSPYYETAWKMLGATQNPKLGASDLAFKELADRMGRKDHFSATQVAVFFGEPDKQVEDPYFGGKGPGRSGCNFCGACMTGCRHNAKNTLDKNYLHLAELSGAEILAEHRVVDVIPVGKNGGEGYEVVLKQSTSFFPRKTKYRTKGIVFAGGVLGTVPLLLKLKKKRLPGLSDCLGDMVRTNNEALIGTVSFDTSKNLSEGVAIGSIIELDENTHIEPVRYGNGSGFWRILMMPMVTQRHFLKRMLLLLASPFREFGTFIKMLSIKDFGKQSSVILFMQHLDSTLKLTLGLPGLRSSRSSGEKPTAFLPAAHETAREFARILQGANRVLATETLTGIPTTAHILGGCVMGASPEEGVIDQYNRVYGYENLLICDGSTVSANPGVNPALTITAIAERAMNFIADKRTN